MLRIVSIAAALAVGACATKPITSDEFAPHGRFKADQCQPAAPPKRSADPITYFDGPAGCAHEARERAFAECRAQAIRDFNQAANSQRGAIAAAVAAYQAGTDSIRGCMDAKGYSWTTPR